LTERHFISKKAEKWLNKNDLTLEHVEKKFKEKIEELKKKKYVTEKQPWSEHPKKMKRKVGRFIILKQSNFPFKMFVLQEVFLEGENEPEVRLGYYIVSPKTLIQKGELRLVWGQYNPNIPKQDFIELLRKAKEKGITESKELSW
jgi:hypothetical protein